jgi:hypothetical protein
MCFLSYQTKLGLVANNYQEPPTGPKLIAVNRTATIGDKTGPVTVYIIGGPGEPVAGTVKLRNGSVLFGSKALIGTSVTFFL